MIKAADMMIARRADTRARADFATWKMMAKLNGASALPEGAQGFLASYKTLLAQDSISKQQVDTQEALVRQYQGVVQSDQGWLHRICRPGRAQFFAKLLHVRGNRGVRDPKDIRHASVVQLNLEDLRIWISRRKREDIFEIRAAP